MNYQVENVLQAQATLGECPLWDERQQVLWFVDILAPALHRFDPASGEHQVWPVAEHLGCIGLREKGGFIAALRSGVYFLDEQGQIGQRIAENPGNAELSRFNDGCVDPFGRFWCGSIWEPQDRDGAKLCYVDDRLQLRVHEENIRVSNGLAFSPDKRWMYHTDTPKGMLYRYPLDASGEPGPREVLRQFMEEEGGNPDGAAVDSEGFYWSAMFDGGRVVRINPNNGEIVDEISLPVRWPTMVAFGGPDLKTLYITSSREDLSEEDRARYPQSGDLFATRVEVAGQLESRFIER